MLRPFDFFWGGGVNESFQIMNKFFKKFARLTFYWVSVS